MADVVSTPQQLLGHQLLDSQGEVFGTFTSATLEVDKAAKTVTFFDTTKGRPVTLYVTDASVSNGIATTTHPLVVTLLNHLFA